jgi:hypothetical protein
VALTVVLGAASTLFSRRIRPSWLWAVALGGIAFSVTMTHFRYSIPYDFKLFWQCGRAVRSGVDYYALEPTRAKQVILNPPTALPVFVAFASMNLRAGARLWTVANVLGGLALVPLACRLLSLQPGPTRPRIEPSRVAILTAAVLLSNAYDSTVVLGQLSILTALAILFALLAQVRSRPVLAGVALGVASVKIGTVVPFLLLFVRGRDRLAWASFAATCVILAIVLGGAAALPEHVWHWLRNIRLSAGEGMVNDYSYLGPAHGSMIGLDHALYRLGLRDRMLIGALNALGVLGIGAGVAWVALDRDTTPGMACSLIALYSVLFFYHRVYDTVILALPLAYAAWVAPAAVRPAKVGLIVGASAILADMFLFPKVLTVVERRALEWPIWGTLLEATVLACPTWLVLIALGGFAWAALEQRRLRAALR